MMMANDAFSRLLKVISLERKQGYRNKAVIGGLDKFASRWEPDARAEAANEAAVNEIVALLIGYPAVEDITARERIIDQIIRRTQDASPMMLGLPPGESRPIPPQPRPAEPPAQPAPEPRPSRGPTEAGGAPTVAKPTPPGAPVSAAPKPVAVEAAEAAPPRPLPARSKPETPPPPGRPTPAPAPEPPPLSASRPAPVSAADAPVSAPPARPKPAIQVEAAPPPPPQPPASEPVEPAAEPRPRPRQVTPESSLDAPITRLPGIGPSFAEKLAKLGVTTVRDLLYLLPHRYDDFSHLRTIDKLRWGEEVTVIGTVWDLKSRIIGENRKLIVAVVGDGTGEMEMTWFSPYVERQLRTGRAYTFAGKIDNYRGRMLMRNPEFEPLDREQLNTGRRVPVYPLTEGITIHWLRAVMNRAVDAFAAQMPDFLPEAVRREAGVMPLVDALRQIHFPDNDDLLNAAHRRLSFDEFLLLQLGVLAARQRFRSAAGRALRIDETTLAPFLAALPFAMTGAQQRVLADITADLRQAQPMSRLLQGDVGSGKTAVAAAALWAAVANGSQGAIMAPTEILAEQHARSFGKMFAGLKHPLADRPVRIVLLTGSQKRGEREEALAALAAGEADIAIGTHALIQGEVAFRDLAAAVVDEQHRFGVEQRAALRQKGAAAAGAPPAQPHMLVMSATPIPRSLALTIYGDLDVSVIDEMPAGRTPIKTKWLTTAQRERAYDFIRRQAAEGRQAFIVYPLVEAPDAPDPAEDTPGPALGQTQAAVEEHARLTSAIFPKLRLGLLHGRLRGDEKDAVMRAFSAGELDVLVATSVVEVGIDVPNATVIVIEGAERFGLAQLHQFRGRVGRGNYPSYCILISDTAETEGVRRLQALEGSTDGFALAQIDLDMRGPGDFFGTRQSGLPALHAAQLGDLRTLEVARTAAQRLFAADPGLNRPEHRALADRLATFWTETTDAS